MSSAFEACFLHKGSVLWKHILMQMDVRDALGCFVLCHDGKFPDEFWCLVLERDFSLKAEDCKQSDDSLNDFFVLYRRLANLCGRVAWFPGPYRPVPGGTLLGHAKIGPECCISFDLVVHARQNNSFGSVALFGKSERDPVPGLWLFPESLQLHANYNWAGGQVMSTLSSAPELPMGEACRIEMIVQGPLASFYFQTVPEFMLEGIELRHCVTEYYKRNQSSVSVPVYAGEAFDAASVCNSSPANCELMNMLIALPHPLLPMLEVSLRRGGGAGWLSKQQRKL